MWDGMASDEVVLELDVLFICLTTLTAVHAMYTRGIVSGVMLTVFLGVHTAAFEHLSLFLGGTHCHATSEILMVTPCSSLNSVLFYIPWTYVSVEGARRARLHPLAFVFAAGLLQFGFGSVYEMQGPLNNFWHWPNPDGMIANSPSVIPFHGYFPIPGLDMQDAQQAGEVSSISAEGVWKVSRHAMEALSVRWHHFPVLAPYFHFAFGFSWAAGLALTGPIAPTAPPALWRFLVAGLLVCGLFVLPIEAARVLMSSIATDFLGMPLALLLGVVPVLVLPKSKLMPAASADPLLFLISLVMHVYFAAFILRNQATTPPELTAVVLTVTALSLAAQVHCCFHTTQAPSLEKKNN